MYLTRVQIADFRCYTAASFALRYPGEALAAQGPVRLPNVNLLLGNNGSGKSSILKALALAVIGPVIRESGYRPYYLVNRGTESNKASIDVLSILHSQDHGRPGGRSYGTESSRMHTEIMKRGDYESITSTEPKGPGSSNIYLEKNPAFFVVGYGATRRIDDPGLFNPTESSRYRSERYQRIAGLFEPQVALVPLASWLPSARGTEKKRLAEIKNLMKKLLPREIEFTGRMIDKDFSFRVRGQAVPFSALSDGYRAYAGWIFDLLYHLDRTWPRAMPLTEARGLVLVDEVDLHLHPLWQRTVIESVSTALPKLQFVFTSHSPLIAASLQHENIFITDVDPHGQAIIRQSEEGIYGLSADQALESSYFGMPSTRPAGFLAELNQVLENGVLKDPNAALDVMDRLSGIGSQRSKDITPVPRVRRIKGTKDDSI